MITKGKVYQCRGVKNLPKGLPTALRKVFGVRFNAILDPTHRQPESSIRAMVMVYLRQECGYTLSKVGELICRSVSTVQYSIKQHPNRMEVDRDYRVSYEALKEKMK